MGVQPIEIFPQKGLMFLFKAVDPQLEQLPFPQVRGTGGFLRLFANGAFPARLLLFDLPGRLCRPLFGLLPIFFFGFLLLFCFCRLGYVFGLFEGRFFGFFRHRQNPPDVDCPAKVASGQLLLYCPRPFGATGRERGWEGMEGQQRYCFAFFSFVPVFPLLFFLQMPYNF